MRAAILALFAIALSGCNGEVDTMELNYDELIPLDAENLAEDGVKEAYDALLQHLRRYVAQTATVDEIVDDIAPSYTVVSKGVRYAIYSPDLPEGAGRSWGRATYAIFAIINAQLDDSSHRFYAIDGGNDLGGLFLTPAEAEAAKRSLPRRTDWPYIPTPEHPWYGQFH